jgi:hypothetical protein
VRVHGIIKRRLLVNYRVDREVLARQLPPPFRPKLHQGHGVAGICLIRLEEIRPKRFPRMAGVSSENAAHRVAVVWDDERGTHEGVFIPRRDSGSLLNRLAGGRLFPGVHHRARFDVVETSYGIVLDMRSADGEARVHVSAHLAPELPEASIFGSLEAASGFFEPGSVGFSPGTKSARLEGVELKTKTWKVEALEVERVESSWFGDGHRFPPGSLDFDCALLMRNIAHEWHPAGEMYV